MFGKKLHDEQMFMFMLALFEEQNSMMQDGFTRHWNYSIRTHFIYNRGRHCWTCLLECSRISNFLSLESFCENYLTKEISRSTQLFTYWISNGNGHKWYSIVSIQLNPLLYSSLFFLWIDNVESFTAFSLVTMRLSTAANSKFDIYKTNV